MLKLYIFTFWCYKLECLLYKLFILQYLQYYLRIVTYLHWSLRHNYYGFQYADVILRNNVYHYRCLIGHFKSHDLIGQQESLICPSQQSCRFGLYHWKWSVLLKQQAPSRAPPLLTWFDPFLESTPPKILPVSALWHNATSNPPETRFWLGIESGRLEPNCE